MRVVKIVIGIVLCLFAFGWAITAMVDQQPTWLIGTGVCTLLAILLFRKTKKDKEKAARQKQRYAAKQPVLPAVPTEVPAGTGDVVAVTDTETPAAAYLQDAQGRTIGRADGKPLNDADAAYLVRSGVDRAMQQQISSANPKFHRTPEEQELGFRFYSRHGAQSDKVCDVFQDISVPDGCDLDEAISRLYDCVRAFNEAKEWHYNHSKGAMIWFQDNWEYCHNSQRECFCWIDPILEKIKRLQKEKDVIAPWILEHAQEGFLQTEIYAAFPHDEKADLRAVIDRLVGSGAITKEKRGKTYFVVQTR